VFVRTCTIDGKGASSVLVVFYLGRHFRECIRCVFLLVNVVLPFALLFSLFKVFVVRGSLND
jgi:hypothetical protein